MTDATASLPPKPVLAHPPTGATPGLEDDTVATGDTGQFWSTEEGPTFAEFLDIINPLHHIPGISTIYRAITGDEIGAGPRFIGGMLFGGPIGALAAGVTALFEEASGGDLGHHLAELYDDITGGGGDAPAVAFNVGSVGNAGNAGNAQDAAAATAGAANGQQAALPRATPEAAILNRIALNPAAALGAAQAMPMGAIQNIGRNAADTAPQTAAQPSPSASLNASLQAAAPAVPLPQGAKIFPAHPTRSAAPHPMLMPFGGNRPDGVVRTSTPTAPTAQLPAQQASQQTAPQVSAAVSRSRRQQADLMLAQWAAQQMAQQNAAPGGSRKAGSGNEDDDAPARNAAAHPMLPPRNASPEWYAQAMNKALNRYEAGSNTLPAAVPALSVTR